ncbi:bifunctional metallophosphatase/5'-nucleotidase [Nitrosopumilus sp.]|uniref:bifunctional metallophosphatase/5'-nucleotidase n=1 Tax=Nitrosopumilus sp. TaxID=2024843 RepID=UPI003B5C53E6
MKAMQRHYESGSVEKIKKLLDKNPKMVLIHVTDTYFIEESNIDNTVDLPGFARLYSLIHRIRTDPVVQKNKVPVLVLHGGDFLYPSLMSIYFGGRQMVDILNACGFDYCTLGNHDFDGGIESLKTNMSNASFEIICANIRNPKAKNSLKISDYSIHLDNSNKLFMAITGIVGKATLRKARQNGLETVPVESSLKQTIGKIQKDHAEINHLVILSHMDNKEDDALLKFLDKNWDGYLYLFGGHDHNEILSYSDKNPKSVLLKGQSNCRTVQIIGIPRLSNPQKTDSLQEQVIVMNSAELAMIPPNSEIQRKVRQWESKLEEYLDEQKSDRVIKRFKKETVLDATELQLRKGSTNFGNFVADCMLDFTGSDIALINSGHFRGDRKIGNILKRSDLFRIFVLDKKDTLLKITMTRKECMQFLQHAYSEEGRGKILQVSKNAIEILQESKPEDKLSVVMLWDMLKTNDDGFATILAKNRNATASSIISGLKKHVILGSSLFDVLEKSSKHVKYDPQVRISVEKSRFFS